MWWAQRVLPRLAPQPELTAQHFLVLRVPVRHFVPLIHH
jgi:hypothetical protein